MEKEILILVIVEIIYFIIGVITMILFRKGNLVLSSHNKEYDKFLQKHIIWFHILYSFGWLVPWALVIYSLIKNKLKNK